MKIIIATDSMGQLLGAVHGHSLSEKKGDVEVDDDMANITDAAEFGKRLQAYLPDS